MSGNLLAFALPLHGKGITKGDFSIMNKPYAQMSRAELTAELSEQEALYGASKEKHYQTYITKMSWTCPAANRPMSNWI